MFGKCIFYPFNVLFIDSKVSLNGSIITSAPLKNRPRIPTPDVAKDGMDKENRFSISSVSAAPISPNRTMTTSPMGTTTVASGVALTPQQFQTSAGYKNVNNNDMPVLGTIFLTPITENDPGSVHNSLTPNSPTTNALAKAILPAQIQANSAEWRCKIIFLYLQFVEYLL